MPGDSKTAPDYPGIARSLGNMCSGPCGQQPCECARLAEAVAGEIERLRTVIRVNALRWMPGITHEQIDRIIEGRATDAQ